MLWPVVLPFKITFCLLAGIVALVTIASPLIKWKPIKTFLITSCIAVAGFIPSCAAIMSVIDSRRFGVFQYQTLSEVDDMRVELFLPPQAKNITVDKYGAGHRAKYSISRDELDAFIDGLWTNHGDRSMIQRNELEPGIPVAGDTFDFMFKDLGWPPFDNAVELHGPVASDGAGATYFFDPATKTAYHRAGYF